MNKKNYIMGAHVANVSMRSMNARLSVVRSVEPGKPASCRHGVARSAMNTMNIMIFCDFYSCPPPLLPFTAPCFPFIPLPLVLRVSRLLNGVSAIRSSLKTSASESSPSPVISSHAVSSIGLPYTLDSFLKDHMEPAFQEESGRLSKCSSSSFRSLAPYRPFDPKQHSISGRETVPLRSADKDAVGSLTVCLNHPESCPQT
jgi:hypothetical protein